MSFRKDIVFGVLIASLATSGIVLAQGATTPRAPNPVAAKVKNPIPADAASLERGKKVYNDRCANCHLPAGEGGEGHGEGGPAPPSIIKPTLEFGSSDGEIFSVTKNGILPDLYMPMFEGVISDKEIWDAVNYVQNVLRKKK